MTTAAPNPNGCCGVAVGCCPQPLPETLRATIENLVGCECAGSIEMELIHIPVEARWEGEAPFCTGCVALRLRCLGSDCEDFTLEYGDCTCVGGGFGLHDCSCEPLVLVFEGGGGNPCCDQPATSHLRVTVTE